MTEQYNFNVDENGEDALLYFLKHGMKKEFDEALAAGHDPFVPSPYGQCCAGLAGGTGFLEFERFEEALQKPSLILRLENFHLLHRLNYCTNDCSGYF